MSAITESMAVRHLDELIAVERTYWWHVAKRSLAIDLLQRWFPPPARLIEAGIGGGANLLAFHDLGYQVTGFDLMPESVAHAQSLGLHDTHVHDVGEPWPVHAGVADVVVMLDVIEHVPDAPGVLRNAAETLNPDGGILVTVPALPALMGPWDRMLGHHRRYTGRMLREHATAAGLRLAWLSSWNAFSLPPALLIRTLEKLGRRERSAEFPPVSPRLNALLIAVARVERRLISTTGLFPGLSMVGVLKR
jgi:SAM-dependent methyltransferase